MGITTRRADVIWNYVGTIVSMTSGFILLPLLMAFLTSDELGLWYVYVAVANLAMLFEFGFQPTFARNIVYVVSGAKSLAAKGCSHVEAASEIDWHLLNAVIRASKIVYAVIAFVVLAALALGGTAYIAYITQGVDSSGVWASWVLFCVAIFLNLYFLYSITILRGYGDVAGENQSRTFAKLVQLALSAILLFLGVGLVGAAVGYLASAVAMRVFALVRIRSHSDIEQSRRSDKRVVSFAEVRGVFGAISHVAWRDGVVQLCCYASTQAMSILSSIFLGLAATGTYSILLQFATAVCGFASAYPKSFFPAMQAAFAERARERQRRIVSSSIVAYWCIWLVGAAGVCFVALPILPFFKAGFVADYPLFLALAAYMALWNQHSIFCNYIVSMNEVPYLKGYLFAAVLGIAMVWLFAGTLGWGAWGIVLGQALSQVVYNNWKWPRYLCSKIGISYSGCLREGFRFWAAKIKHS